jgi:anti-sigma-K factor RskA
MVKNPDTSSRDQIIERRSKAVFDASVSELDSSIRGRLRRGRHAAVAQASGTSRSTWWIPALSTVAVAALVLWLTPVLRPQQQPLTDGLVARAEDMSLLMTEDNLELIEEMEFYAWLDDAAGAFDAPAEAGHGDS